MANLKTESLQKMILNAPLLCWNMYDDESNEDGENRWYLYQMFAVVVVYLDLPWLLDDQTRCCTFYHVYCDALLDPPSD